MDKGEAGAKEIASSSERSQRQGERNNLSRGREVQRFKTGDKGERTKLREVSNKIDKNGENGWWNREKAEREQRDYHTAERRKQAEAQAIAKARWFLKRDEKDMKAMFNKPKKGNG